MNVAAIQRLLDRYELDGWLFIDLHNRDLIACRMLGLDETELRTRRWCVWLPRKGEVIKIVSAVEEYALDGVHGRNMVYRSLDEFQSLLGMVLRSVGTVAMQYSPMNELPQISMVDAGTMELVRSYNVQVVSSADLVQGLEAVVDKDGYRLHREAGAKVDAIRRQAFEEIARRIGCGEVADELGMRNWIDQRFRESELTCDGDLPIVAANEHSADPHFEPRKDRSRSIRPGDVVLMDLWAREDRQDGIYYDISWCGYVGKKPRKRHQEVFDIVRRARDVAVAFVIKGVSEGRPCSGKEVDDVCRRTIAESGYGDYFVHRTGHNIGREVHGRGVNIDNFETHDSRLLIPGICFSIEPGIYVKGEFGVRCELNMFIRHDGVAEVTGEVQEELVGIG